MSSASTTTPTPTQGGRGAAADDSAITITTPPPPSPPSRVETPYTCHAQCLGDDTAEIIQNNPEFSKELKLKAPVNEKCPVCVNTAASMSDCDAHLDSVTCSDGSSTAVSYIYKGLGCGYRCMGSPSAIAAVLTPDVQASISAQLPPAVDKASKGVLAHSGVPVYWYYVAVGFVLLAIVAHWLIRRHAATRAAAPARAVVSAGTIQNAAGISGSVRPA